MIRPVFVLSDPFSDMVLLRRRSGAQEGRASAGEFIEAQRNPRREATLPWLSWPLVGSNRKPLLVLGGVVVAALVAVVIAMAALGGGGQETAAKADYQATIVIARDRVDFAFAEIGKADSIENLIERLDTASARVGAVAEDVDGAAVAPGFEQANDDLADALHRFSWALAATADQFADPSSAGFGLENINSLGFSEWDEVNAVLTEMQEQGLEVELLERH
jgi:hypothetical protein